MTPPYSLWHLRSFLWTTKPWLCVKQICLPSVISNLKNNKSELRKTVRPTGFKKTTIERIHSRDQHLCKFMGTKESFYIRKESNSYRICLEHQYGRRDVMWKRPIAIRFNLLQVCASLLPFVFPVLFITSFNSLSDYLFHSIWWQFPLFEFWLPSPCTASFQAFSVNAFQWRIRETYSKLSRTTWPETHRLRTIMRARD